MAEVDSHHGEAHWSLFPSGRWRLTRVVLAIALLLALSALRPESARADEGWVIRSFDAQIDVDRDGSLRIAETLLVDFGSLQRRGIFRDIPVVYDYSEDTNRVYDLSVVSVTDARGSAHRYEVTREGSFVRIRIGDPEVYLSGQQSYRIVYEVRGALNGFADHDELYWNVNGRWPVRTERVATTVRLPGANVQRTACYQGALGSQEQCRARTAGGVATFESTRALPEGQQMTVVVAIPKGVVADPQPKLERKPREVEEFFDVTPATLGGGVAVLLLSLGALGWGWWRHGRDRRYTTVYYLTDDPREETRPLLTSDPIVVEYAPPEGLRPAQLGLLLDESADTLDVTATIVDLAVRGYLRIAEVPRDGLLSGILGKDDWELTRTEKDASDLLAYEQIVLQGLFDRGSPTRVSDLKNRFYKHLSRARESLYSDSSRRKWFARRPDHARAFWAGAGVAVAAAGAGAVFLLGSSLGAGLIGVPVVASGLFLAVLSHWMPKRTALGSELMRRTLGFRQYVATAETDRQRFNEQRNLFAEYLPYAMVFHCVDKWANAFRDVDVIPSTQGWYVGPTPFHASSFSRDVQGFSSAISSAIVSTPGSSGSSGFSGGSSGGGGGGGGGGSW